MKRSTKVERRRTRWTAADARAVLAELAASGQPLAEFSRKRGWHPVRLSRWRRRLESRPSSAALLPVTVTGARAIRIGSADLVVETPSMRVEVHDHERVAAAWVAELVRLTEVRA